MSAGNLLAASSALSADNARSPRRIAQCERPDRFNAMVTPLSIALTADPEIPVPPTHYGGIERIVDMVAHGLVEAGHQVTLFAHPDSASAGRLVPWRGHSSRSSGDTAVNASILAGAILRGRFDLIHSFARIAYLGPLLPMNIPKIMTYQRAISPRSVRFAHFLSRGTLTFTAISDWMMRDVAGVGEWSMIPNGVPLHVYKFAPQVAPDAPFVFLGRIEEIKGPHLAIDIAKRAGRKLVIAGNIPTDKRAWADQHVLAHVDGDRVRYVGPVDDAQKNALLGQAAAFLMPILWDEPFGIVMAEAMACGTPVLGLDRGAVREVVEDGVTGFVRGDVEGLVAATGAIARLDRAACRRRVEVHYSRAAIVDSYLRLYRSRVERLTRPRAQ
jgi:glycosyltransferase involved in cell wall biosynthesis